MTQLSFGGFSARRYVRPSVAGPERIERDAEGNVAFSPKRTRSEERDGWTYFGIGGWPEASQWIDPRTVPLCRDHEHAAPSMELMQALRNFCLCPSLFARRCLTAPWREYPAGTTCLTYGSLDSMKWDLFVMAAE